MDERILRRWVSGRLVVGAMPVAVSPVVAAASRLPGPVVVAHPVSVRVQVGVYGLPAVVADPVTVPVGTVPAPGVADPVPVGVPGAGPGPGAGLRRGTGSTGRRPPVAVSGASVTEMKWDNSLKTFVTPDGNVRVAEASNSPFDLGKTVELLLASPYYKMNGASAAITLQLVEFANAFPGWQRTEFFFNADAVVDTLKYKVDTQEQVTELGHAQGKAVLNSMSFVVDNTYGLPEWGNFTVKRTEQVDADEVVFVEGIRNGAPANTLNRNLFLKNIKGVLFDSRGVTVVARKGKFYVVSSSEPKRWLILEPQPLPQPAMVIPTLIVQ